MCEEESTRGYHLHMYRDLIRSLLYLSGIFTDNICFVFMVVTYIALSYTARYTVQDLKMYLLENEPPIPEDDLVSLY